MELAVKGAGQGADLEAVSVSMSQTGAGQQSWLTMSKRRVLQEDSGGLSVHALLRFLVPTPMPLSPFCASDASTKTAALLMYACLSSHAPSPSPPPPPPCPARQPGRSTAGRSLQYSGGQAAVMCGTAGQPRQTCVVERVIASFTAWMMGLHKSAHVDQGAADDILY